MNVWKRTDQKGEQTPVIGTTLGHCQTTKKLAECAVGVIYEAQGFAAAPAAQPIRDKGFSLSEMS